MKDVDANIDIMLHIENTGSLSGLQWWVDNALQRNVSFDILGLSAYEPVQGPSSNWASTMKSMASWLVRPIKKIPSFRLRILGVSPIAR